MSLLMPSEPHSLSSLPPLKEELKQLYVVLRPSERTIFRRVYQYLYKYLTVTKEYQQDFNFLSHYFLIFPLLESFKGLTERRLSILAWLWLLTGAGKYPVNTAKMNLNTTQYNTIKYYMNLKYLRRTRFDPAQPYAIKTKNPSYLSFTSDGVAYYKSILNRYNELVLAFHGADWSSRKRKP